MKYSIALICALAVVCCGLLQLSAAKAVNSHDDDDDDNRDDGYVYLAAKKVCQEGTASVSTSGKDCPSKYTETARTAQVRGTPLMTSAQRQRIKQELISEQWYLQGATSTSSPTHHVVPVECVRPLYQR